MGKYFANHVSDINLICRIYGKNLELNSAEQPDSKMGKELEQTFLQRRDANGQIST